MLGILMDPPHSVSTLRYNLYSLMWSETQKNVIAARLKYHIFDSAKLFLILFCFKIPNAAETDVGLSSAHKAFHVSI